MLKGLFANDTRLPNEDLDLVEHNMRSEAHQSMA